MGSVSVKSFLANRVMSIATGSATGVSISATLASTIGLLMISTTGGSTSAARFSTGDDLAQSARIRFFNSSGYVSSIFTFCVTGSSKNISCETFGSISRASAATEIRPSP